MRVVRVKATGRDVRGQRKWSHSTRSGAEVTVGCTGVALDTGLVLCPLGAVLRGWEGVAVDVEGTAVESWELLEGRAPSAVECVFALLRFSSPLSAAVGVAAAGGVSDTTDTVTVRQFALHLSQPLWGLVTQQCGVVSRPESDVALLDVSCYEGGEGGLVTGRNFEPMVLANGLRADGAPSGLCVAVSIARLLGGTPSPSLANGWRNVAAPICVISGPSGRWGTGFATSASTVLTAAHVVCARGEISPKTVGVTCGGSVQVATVAHCWIGGWLDLCVLRLERPAEFSFSLSEIPPTVGEKVALLAATQWGGAQMRSSGSVVAIVPFSQIICSNAAFGGCSGAPLVAESNGLVIGMLVSTAARGVRRIPKLSLFLPASVLRLFARNDDARNDDEALRATVEPVWRLALPPLPPKFGSFQKSLL
jgi:hypothetical protein